MKKQLQGGYQTPTRLDRNAWISPPDIEDPENIPEPLGWSVLIRPYPVKTETKIIIGGSDIDYMNYTSNVGRVVKIGPCCWNRHEHKDRDGKQFNWVNVGDFVSWPRHAGDKIKFKGVSYIIVNDEEVVQRLSDPQIFDNDYYSLDIPEEHLFKYNTIYNTKNEKGEK